MDKEGPLFECEKFLSRKGWARKDRARKLDFKESTVGNWCSNASTPNYAVLAKLIEFGMSANELFGDKIGSLLLENSVGDYNGGGPKPPDTPELRAGQQQARKPIDHNDPEWQKLVKNALAEMKQNGQL